MKGWGEVLKVLLPTKVLWRDRTTGLVHCFFRAGNAGSNPARAIMTRQIIISYVCLLVGLGAYLLTRDSAIPFMLGALPGLALFVYSLLMDWAHIVDYILSG